MNGTIAKAFALIAVDESLVAGQMEQSLPGSRYDARRRRPPHPPRDDLRELSPQIRNGSQTPARQTSLIRDNQKHPGTCRGAAI